MQERTNDAWLKELQSAHAAQAISDLRAILVKGLTFALAGRIRQDLDSLVEDFAQDALLKILENLETFRGESRFTTWAQKIAVRVAFSELRRLRWKDVSLQDLVPPDHQGDYTPPVLADLSTNPEITTSQALLMEKVVQVIQEELTDKQRTAITAILAGGMPIEEVAQRMNSNRNALYKLIHDARKKLKTRLEAEGLTPQEILASFDEG